MQGPVQFDENGDLLANISLSQIRSGEKVDIGKYVTSLDEVIWYSSDQQLFPGKRYDSWASDVKNCQFVVTMKQFTKIYCLKILSIGLIERLLSASSLLLRCYSYNFISTFNFRRMCACAYAACYSSIRRK